MTNNHIKNINQQGGDKELNDKDKIKNYFNDNSRNDVVAFLQKLQDNISEANAEAIFDYFLNETDNITEALFRAQYVESEDLDFTAAPGSASKDIGKDTNLKASTLEKLVKGNHSFTVDMISSKKKSSGKTKYRIAYEPYIGMVPTMFRSGINHLGTAIPKAQVGMRAVWKEVDDDDDDDKNFKMSLALNPSLVPGLGVPGIGMSAPGIGMSAPAIGGPQILAGNTIQGPPMPVRGPPSAQPGFEPGIPLIPLTGGDIYSEESVKFPEYIDIVDMEGGDLYSEESVKFPDFIELVGGEDDDENYHSSSEESKSSYIASVEFPEKIEVINVEEKEEKLPKNIPKLELEELDDKGDNLDDLDEEEDDDEDDDELDGGAVYLSPVLSPTLTISTKDKEFELPVAMYYPSIEYPNVNSDPDLIRKVAKYFFERTMNTWLYSDFEDLLMYLIIEKNNVRLVRNSKEMEKNTRDKDMKSLDLKVHYIADHVMTKYDMKSFLKKYSMKSGIDLWNLKKYKSYVKKSLYKKMKSKLEKLAFHS